MGGILYPSLSSLFPFCLVRACVWWVCTWFVSSLCGVGVPLLVSLPVPCALVRPLALSLRFVFLRCVSCCLCLSLSLSLSLFLSLWSRAALPCIGLGPQGGSVIDSSKSFAHNSLRYSVIVMGLGLGFNMLCNCCGHSNDNSRLSFVISFCDVMLSISHSETTLNFIVAVL